MHLIKKKLIKPPNFKIQNKNYKNSVNYYNESTSSRSLDKVIEPVYKESNKKRRKRKRNSNKSKVSKYVQLPTQSAHVQQLFSIVPQNIILR